VKPVLTGTFHLGCLLNQFLLEYTTIKLIFSEAYISEAIHDKNDSNQYPSTKT